MLDSTRRKLSLAKALNTYVADICSVRTPFVRYQDLFIFPSNAAIRELMKEGKTLLDVLKILEEGQDAPRKRKRGTIERWLNKGNKTYNAVIAKDYNERLQEDVWVLVHFGKFTRRRLK